MLNRGGKNAQPGRSGVRRGGSYPKESQRDAIRTESLKWNSIFDPQSVAAEGQGYVVETLRSAPLETRIDFCVTRVAG